MLALLFFSVHSGILELKKMSLTFNFLDNLERLNCTVSFCQISYMSKYFCLSRSLNIFVCLGPNHNYVPFLRLGQLFCMWVCKRMANIPFSVNHLIVNKDKQTWQMHVLIANRKEYFIVIPKLGDQDQD